MTHRLLLIGDSHTREIGLDFKKNLPSCLVFTVSVPQGLDEIIDRYHINLPHILNFNPTLLILHAGHNDINYHHKHNLHPINPRVLTQQLLHFTSEVVMNHPNIRPIISSIFPRTHTDRSYLTSEQVVSYTKKVKRHGQHLVTVTNNLNVTPLVNNCLWLHVNSSIKDPEPFDSDGLHLSKVGRNTVAAEWVSVIFPQTEAAN
jgi:lysophospholipase L1-like esterase